MEKFNVLRSTKTKTTLSILVICAFTISSISCASTGPKVTREDRKRMEHEFNVKFLKASGNWLERVYRVGYRLLTVPIPNYLDKKPKYGFVGVGVEKLSDDARKVYDIGDEVRGVIVRGLYSGSKAEAIDLRPGDVIVKVDGKKVKSLGKYFKIIRTAKDEKLAAQVWRAGKIAEVDLPVEKVYYNAQFFLEPTPNVDASAAFSKIAAGIGAIRYCQNDDELAVILGHELAHVTLKHVAKKTGLNIFTGVVYGVAAAVINYFTFSTAGSLMVYPVQQAADAAISRRYEREADYFGMRHAFHAGYDVEHGAKVFSRLATDEPGYSLLAYTFATHPKWPERFLRLEKITEELEALFPGKALATQESANWEVTIPVRAGETVEEALERLAQMEKPPLAAPAVVPRLLYDQ